MLPERADVVICGAGLAGAAVAYHLTRRGLREVLLIDERPPLSLTSSASTECYRNWWPGPGDTMVQVMNHSIDLLEAIAAETDNRIQLNRRGYLFVTSDAERVGEFVRASAEAASLGAGPSRIHRGAADDAEYVPSPVEGWAGVPTGSDVIVDQGLLRRLFPYLSHTVVAALHARRCGWLSAQALGNYFLEQAQANGARLVRARLDGVEVQGGKIGGVQLSGDAPRAVATECFVNAAGPGFAGVGRMLGLDLPVFCELHMRVRYPDADGAIPYDAPMVIGMDPLTLVYRDDERAALQGTLEGERVLGPFPPGAHMRPAGSAAAPQALGIWTFDTAPREPIIPPPCDAQHGELTLRALARLIPRFERLLGRVRPQVDGGYYTKTAENRPLIGPTPIEGAYLMGAISGFGVMGSSAFGELLADHITHASLPAYAPAFLLTRYDDPAYRSQLSAWGSSGQL
jgi:sarcosine oxidase, subunit beta